jgi:hypothetical protein
MGEETETICDLTLETKRAQLLFVMSAVGKEIGSV